MRTLTPTTHHAPLTTHQSPLTTHYLRWQVAAHRRSQQLATQLQQSFKTVTPVIPLSWRPADMDAQVPVFVATATAAPPHRNASGGASLFPSAPRGPVAR